MSEEDKKLSKDTTVNLNWLNPTNKLKYML